MDYCINKTISICNNLYNYCINYCLKDNHCYCRCIDNEVNNNKLCVYHNALNVNLLIFIILIGSVFCVTCYCVKLRICGIMVNTSRIINNNVHLDNNTSGMSNISTEIEDSNSLPKYNQLEHHAPPPEYFVIMYNDVSNNVSNVSPTFTISDLEIFTTSTTSTTSTIYE